MNSSDSPNRVSKAFGVNGNKNAIPIDSTPTTISSGVATFDSGFPPVTMQPLSAGGIPPSGMDFNGVLYSVTLQQQWQNAGMTYPFSSSFSTQISGYPKGAILPSSTYTGQWLNLNEQNSISPENSNGSSTGWVPINNYGVTTISGLTNQSVTLTSNQASKERIVISGTLTSNINIIFPAWIKSWVVKNNCTGNFSVTCKTLLGNGVQVTSGFNTMLFCDGNNITFDLGTASQRNVGNSTNQIPDMSYFLSGGDDNGWFSLPSGVIIQYGSGSFGNPSSTSYSQEYSLPRSYPNKHILTMPVSTSTATTSNSANVILSIINKSLGNFTLRADTNNLGLPMNKSQTFSFISIGM